MDIPVEELKDKRQEVSEKISDLMDEAHNEASGSPRASQLSGERYGLHTFLSWLDTKIKEAEEE